MPKREKATPEEAKVVEDILEEKRKAAATVSVEARVTETSLGDVKIKYCVLCDAKSSDFTQPGKELHGKWLCPNCVNLV